MRLFPPALALCLAAGCVGPEDTPSSVRDLRVLDLQLEPPEVMLPLCPRPGMELGKLPPTFLAAIARPLTVTALVVDPKGEGREISYDLWACASTGDRACEAADGRTPLKVGRKLAAGQLLVARNELVIPDVPLGRAQVGRPLDDGLGATEPFLLEKVLEKDAYKGLGGIRVPVVLHVKAGDEEIWAQKLMVYSCPFFPDMKPNVTPRLPGLTLDGEPWEEGKVPELEGSGPFTLVPEEFFDRQEHYVVPSLSLQRVDLDEAWKLSWHTDVGRITPNETGGVDFAGEFERHKVELTPARGAGPREFSVWVVVRDGRGGTSWLVRRARHVP